MTRFAIALLLACAACSANTADSTSAAAESVTVAPHEQFVPYVANSAVEANLAELRARTGGDWVLPNGSAPQFVAFLSNAARSIPAGAPTVTLDANGKIQAVRDFLTKNADLLGVDDPAAAAVSAIPGYPDLLQAFGGPDPLLGLLRGYQLYINLGSDGLVQSLYTYAPRFPALNLDPSNAFDHDLVSQKLVGQELTIAGASLRPIAATDLGQLASATMSAITQDGPSAGVLVKRVLKLSIQADKDESDHVCSFPYTFWYLTVDPQTGAVLDGLDTQCMQW